MSECRVVSSKQSQIDSSGNVLPRGGDGPEYVLPTASATVKGGIRIGARLSIGLFFFYTLANTEGL